MRKVRREILKWNHSVAISMKGFRLMRVSTQAGMPILVRDVIASERLVRRPGFPGRMNRFKTRLLALIDNGNGTHDVETIH